MSRPLAHVGTALPLVLMLSLLAAASAGAAAEPAGDDDDIAAVEVLARAAAAAQVLEYSVLHPAGQRLDTQRHVHPNGSDPPGR